MLRCAPLEIPPVGPPVRRHQYKKKSRTSPLNVVYIGAAREEKGFLLIPDVIKTISVSAEKKNIKFTIQCSPQIIGYLPVISEAIAKLRNFPSWIVNLIEDSQSMNEYFATIDDADVILLCYDKTRYGVRGSGIAVEAVAFGKIIIATPETFPAYVAEDAAVLASNSEEVANAIISISQNKEFYSKRANERQKKYLEENSGKKYFEMMRKRVIKLSNNIITKESNIQERIIERFNKKTSIPIDVNSKLKLLLQGNDNEASLEKLVTFL